MNTTPAAAAQVNWSAATSGLVSLQLAVLAQLTAVAATPPKLPVVATTVVLKPRPLIVTTVPPPAGPLAGLIPVTVGGGGGGTLIRSRMLAVVRWRGTLTGTP